MNVVTSLKEYLSSDDFNRAYGRSWVLVNGEWRYIDTMDLLNKIIYFRDGGDPLDVEDITEWDDAFPTGYLNVPAIPGAAPPDGENRVVWVSRKTARQWKRGITSDCISSPIAAVCMQNMGMGQALTQLTNRNSMPPINKHFYVTDSKDVLFRGAKVCDQGVWRKQFSAAKKIFEAMGGSL